MEKRVDNDNDLRELFSRYEPTLSPDSLFMAGVRESLEKVELVKKANEAFHKRQRRAMAIAAAGGCLVGILLSVIAPMIAEWIDGLSLSLPFIDMELHLYECRNIIAWIIVAVFTIFSTVSFYELALTRRSVAGPTRP